VATGSGASAAYNAGVAAGTTSSTAAYNAGVAAATGAAPAGYAMGVSYAALPPGAISINKNGQTYYISGNTFFQPNYGAGGVHYVVVPAP
jgi:hypothetical protein